MSKDQKLDRVRVVSSHQGGPGSRRRRTDRDAPIIEIGSERMEQETAPSGASRELWGISRLHLLIFIAGCGIGGVVAAIFGSFRGPYG